MAPAHPPLFYVVGPSGAGKDTLLAGARARLDGRSGTLFAHRYITRPAAAGGENHVFLSDGEFQGRSHAGLFALEWEGHGFCYGIGIEIHTWLALGFAVVVNGSRSYLPVAAERFPSLVPVLVTAPPDVIAGRLAERGREDASAIRARMRRNDAFAEIRHPALRVVDNGGTEADGLAALLSVLTEGRRARASA